ncbi:MAG: hypothetical protein GXO78_06350 [Calditrichaeota bacterium]|nr:hypothetical protein [Calditrichota bacterium]
MVKHIVMLTATLALLLISPSHSDTHQLMEKALRVFIDCPSCDLDYIRENIPYVHYLRDWTEAEVHILVTIRETGSGGREYTLTFIGKQRFRNLNDTLTYISSNDATDDEIRKGLVHKLKLGLMRYVAHTPVADFLTIQYLKKVTTAQQIDRWKNWIFSIRLNVFSNGEKLTRFTSSFGNISAKKITLDWKIIFQIYGNYNESTFRYPGTRLTSISRSHGIRSSIVRSLTDHWSLGFFVNYFSSSYRNIRWQIYGSPALEFNVFPYSESTRRSLTISYAMEPQAVAYVEETIFNKVQEFLWKQSLMVGVSFQQPWGRLAISVLGSQYLHDLSKNRVVLFSSASWRIFKGFSVNIFGQYSRIRDQLSLPRLGATPEEVLLRRKELETTYSYFLSFGISYAFGSLFSNVVNTRFDDRLNGGYSIQVSL